MYEKHLKLTWIMSNLKKNKPKKNFAARNAIFNWNLAREKKSLATPAIEGENYPISL